MVKVSPSWRARSTPGVRRTSLRSVPLRLESQRVSCVPAMVTTAWSLETRASETMTLRLSSTPRQVRPKKTRSSTSRSPVAPFPSVQCILAITFQ